MVLAFASDWEEGLSLPDLPWPEEDTICVKVPKPVHDMTFLHLLCYLLCNLGHWNLS